jgi:hypothetical protein
MQFPNQRCQAKQLGLALADGFEEDDPRGDGGIQGFGWTRHVDADGLGSEGLGLGAGTGGFGTNEEGRGGPPIDLVVGGGAGGFGAPEGEARETAGESRPIGGDEGEMKVRAHGSADDLRVEGVYRAGREQGNVDGGSSSSAQDGAKVAGIGQGIEHKRKSERRRDSQGRLRQYRK